MSFLKQYIKTIRIFFAVLGLIAIIAQFFVSAKNPQFNLLNFFSYFTILSNLFAVYVLFLSSHKKTDLLRGASVVYMLTTAIVYVLLLKSSNSNNPYFVPILDTIHHVVIPFVVLADWLLFPLEIKIKFKEILYWLIYPIVYIVYTLIRGKLTGWYPYVFLRLTLNNNYTLVFSYIFFIGLGIVALAIFTAKVPLLKLNVKK